MPLLNTLPTEQKHPVHAITQSTTSVLDRTRKYLVFKFPLVSSWINYVFDNVRLTFKFPFCHNFPLHGLLKILQLLFIRAATKNYTNTWLYEGQQIIILHGRRQRQIWLSCSTRFAPLKCPMNSKNSNNVDVLQRKIHHIVITDNASVYRWIQHNRNVKAHQCGKPTTFSASASTPIGKHLMPT